MSTFGTLFRVSTAGESHCSGITAIVDGVPPGLQLNEQDIQTQLSRRRPGQSNLTTPVSHQKTYIIPSSFHSISSFSKKKNLHHHKMTHSLAFPLILIFIFTFVQSNPFLA